MPLFLEPRQSVGNRDPNTVGAQVDSGALIIGRGEDADLRLGNPMVSRRHCAISGNGQNWQIVDQSTSGTLLNGQRLVAPQPLRDGDVIAVADTELVVRIVADAGGGAHVPGNAPAGRLNLDSWGKAAGVATVIPNPPPVHATMAGNPLDLLLQTAGLARSSVPLDDRALAQALGTILVAALGGLAGLAQDRQRARRDLKLPDPGGDNPLLAGSGTGAVLARLLAQPGNAAADSIAAACRALDAHQRATLGSWQATFAAALDQFAPEAIRQRASGDAAAWQAYQRAFADRDGFVECFAQEFARRYGALADG